MSTIDFMWTLHHFLHELTSTTRESMTDVVFCTGTVHVWCVQACTSDRSSSNPKVILRSDTDRSSEFAFRTDLGIVRIRSLLRRLVELCAMAQVLDKLIGVLWRLLLGGPDSVAVQTENSVEHAAIDGELCDSVQPARDERKLPEAVEERLSMATHPRQPSRRSGGKHGKLDASSKGWWNDWEPVMLSCIEQSDRNLTNTMYDSAASGTLVMNIGLTLSAPQRDSCSLGHLQSKRGRRRCGVQAELRSERKG